MRERATVPVHVLAPVVLVAALAGCGAQPAAPQRPQPLDASAAVSEARTGLLAGCSRDTAADPGPESVDEGWAAGTGFTTEQAVDFLRAQNRATALNAWAQCTFPDSYSSFRVDETGVIEAGQPYSAVLSVTDAAGSDPLAHAPLGVLAGHVGVEREPFSYLQMVELANRVDQVLEACDALPATVRPSAMIGLDAYVLSSTDGDAVDGCLDAAQARGELGRDPGRAQVRVEDLGSDGSVIDGPVIVKTGSEGSYDASAARGRVELVDGCLRLVGDPPDDSGSSVLVWGAGTTWDESTQEVVLEDGVRIPMGTPVTAAGATETDLRHVLGPEGERAAAACGGSGSPEAGGSPVRAGAHPEGTSTVQP